MVLRPIWRVEIRVLVLVSRCWFWSPSSLPVCSWADLDVRSSKLEAPLAKLLNHSACLVYISLVNVLFRTGIVGFHSLRFLVLVLKSSDFGLVFIAAHFYLMRHMDIGISVILMLSFPTYLYSNTSRYVNCSTLLPTYITVSVTHFRMYLRFFYYLDFCFILLSAAVQ